MDCSKLHREPKISNGKVGEADAAVGAAVGAVVVGAAVGTAVGYVVGAAVGGVFESSGKHVPTPFRIKRLGIMTVNISLFGSSVVSDS